jgi:hypothetical protein
MDCIAGETAIHPIKRAPSVLFEVCSNGILVYSIFIVLLVVGEFDSCGRVFDHKNARTEVAISMVTTNERAVWHKGDAQAGM